MFREAPYAPNKPAKPSSDLIKKLKEAVLDEEPYPEIVAFKELLNRLEDPN